MVELTKERLTRRGYARHPFFTCGGKRGLKSADLLTLFAAKPERGSTGEAWSG
jgi:hypothetical protein